MTNCRFFRTFIAVGIPAVVLGMGCAADLPSSGDDTSAVCETPVPLGAATNLMGTAKGEACAWLGIRYAAPPVGDKRFLPPAPYTPGGSLVQAAAFGNDCVQNRGMFTEQPISEDCLFLNVWTPRVAARRRASASLPVMVWYYGGGFVEGSANASMYDGRTLVRDGVIVVTVNYRLGPLGYLTHPDILRPDGTAMDGNLGLRDQILALNWVHDHIRSFGGEPDNITIFGESAGAFSTCALIGSPETEGLYRHAIMQSGMCGMGDPVAMIPKTESWLASAGCPVSGPEALDCLLQLDGAAMPKDHPYGMLDGNYPVTGGTTLPRQPLAVLRSGTRSQIDLIAGYNAQEVQLMAMTPTFMRYTEITFTEIWDTFGRRLTPDQLAEMQRHYPVAEYGSGFALGVEVLGDLIFGCPSHDAVAAQADAGARSYLYRFSIGDADYSLEPELRTFHGIDVPFVFGSFGLLGLVSQGESLDRLVALSDRIRRYWTRFAATGDPNGGADPVWPTFASGSTRFELRPDPAATDGVLDARCAFWERTLPLDITRRIDRIQDIVLDGDRIPGL